MALLAAWVFQSSRIYLHCWGYDCRGGYYPPAPRSTLTLQIYPNVLFCSGGCYPPLHTGEPTRMGKPSLTEQIPEKYENHCLSKTEDLFFGTARQFKKNYEKHLEKMQYK